MERERKTSLRSGKIKRFHREETNDFFPDNPDVSELLYAPIEQLPTEDPIDK